MSFDNDIFISYAQLDNVPLTSGAKGWISNFHEALEVKLAQLRGAKPKIWRDPKLRSNDVFAEELVERLGTTAVLLSVLTPRYIISDWCKLELTP
jgi:hypothetical protein